jgi:hypothetical protein
VAHRGTTTADRGKKRALSPVAGCCEVPFSYPPGVTGTRNDVTTRNRWQSFDGVDPVLVWTLSAPAPRAEERRAIVDEVLRAGRSSGVLIAADPGTSAAEGRSDSNEPLPWRAATGAAGAADAAGSFSARVFVRDMGGSIVERTASDAGALLRGLEPLEPAYARRFAASRPFSQAWSVSTATAITIHIAFFTSLWFDETDGELLQRNEPALASFRAALSGIARRRGGRLVAPTSPSMTPSTRD